MKGKAYLMMGQIAVACIQRPFKIQAEGLIDSMRVKRLCFSLLEYILERLLALMS